MNNINNIKSCGIYAVMNKLNGKLYIGQSVHPEQRMWTQIGSPKTNLGRDTLLYGVENFIPFIITYCNQEELDYLERFYILLYHTNDERFGYNKTSGGKINYRFNEDIKIKDGINVKSAWQNKSIEEKEIFKKKLSNSVKTAWSNMTLEERIQRINLQKEGKQNSISKLSDEEKLKRHNKISERRKQFFANMTPEEKKKYFEKIHNKLNTPEIKQKMSEHQWKKLPPIRCIETGEVRSNKEWCAIKMKGVSLVCRGKIPDLKGLHFEFVN